MTQNNADKLRLLEKDIIARRLAGLPNNVTTWKDVEPDDNGVLNVDSLYFKPKGSYLTQSNTQPSYDNTDWEYKNALMYRLFGDDTPMQQYLTQKQTERQSRDNAIYNQYIAMQNIEEQLAEKEKEKRLQEEKVKESKLQEEKEKAAENAKKQADIEILIDNPESTITEINKAIIDNGLDPAMFVDRLSNREQQTEQYRDIEKKIRNDIKNNDAISIKTEIRNSNMPLSFREKLLKLLNETKTIEERAKNANINAMLNAGANNASKNQEAITEAKNAIANNTRKSMLSDAAKKVLKDKGYIWSGTQQKWIQQ